MGVATLLLSPRQVEMSQHYPLAKTCLLKTSEGRIKVRLAATKARGFPAALPLAHAMK